MFLSLWKIIHHLLIAHYVLDTQHLFSMQMAIFFFTAVCCKIDILEIQRVAKMPAAFCLVPATCLDTLMQFAFWPSIRKVAFKSRRNTFRSTQLLRTEPALQCCCWLFYFEAMPLHLCHVPPRGYVPPLFSWCPMFVAGRRSLLKSLLAFIEPGFYEQFGT